MLSKRISIICCIIGLFSVLFLSNKAYAQVSWNQWVQELRAEAIAKGIRPDLFDQVFSTIHEPSRKVLSFDRHQPEHRITFLKYRDTRADPYRIRMGQSALRHNKELLNQIGYKYGVNPCFIVSLWGLETSYGHFMGSFPVVQSLATLAYDSRRSNFFRKELFYALEILNGGHVDINSFKGEWAGASGHPQFLPSSWHQYSVDEDGDGKRDIWRSHPDVFGSIANYLVQNGWQRNQPWAIEVTVPENVATTFANNKISKSITEWKALGLQTIQGQPWPDENLQAELIQPLGGPRFLIFKNFKVLMKWNHSVYYVGSVGYMAEKICGKPLYN